VDPHQIIGTLRCNLKRLLELAGVNDEATVDAEVVDVRKLSCRDSLAELASYFGINIAMDTANLHGSTVSWDSLPLSLREKGVELVASELSIYSPTLIRRCRLSQIVLCSNLKTKIGKSSGCVLSNGETLLLDVGSFEDNWRYGRLSVHHELFHAIDHNDDALGLLDPWWESLNAPGNVYSNELTENKLSDQPGFISTYSRHAVHEDKAELFCHLIVNYGNVEKRMRRDAVIARKVERLKELLYRFSNEFDESFWHKRRSNKPTIQIEA
jgi:hypothetical protein